MKKILAVILAAMLLCGGLAIGAAADEVITADAVTYKVTYNGNGADVTGVPVEQDKVLSQTLTLRTETPARPGHEFKGWATTAAATVAEYTPGGSYTADAAITLYAVWQADTYTVKYRDNAPYGVRGMPSNQVKVHGQTLVLYTTMPTREGFTFMGWGTSPTGPKVYEPGASMTVNESVTLYALWKAQEITPPSWWAKVWRVLVWFVGFGWLWMK